MLTLTSSPPAKAKTLHNLPTYSRFADAKERKRRKQPHPRQFKQQRLQQQQQQCQLRRVPPVQRWQARRKSSTNAAWTFLTTRKR